jgi:DHA2 family multidrug resistance protein-like MFS transporter
MGLSRAASTTDTTVFPDGLPVPRRYWAIVVIVMAIAMSVLDSSIANVALPSIARDLHASDAASIWVINSYQVAILATILPLASLGEVVGYRRIFQAGLVVFTLASLACAFSSSLLTLSVVRTIQGLGAAGIMSVSPALVRFTYPQSLLGRAVGINAFVVAVAAAVGPTLAAAVLAIASWPWLFGINVPIGAVAFVIARRSLPFTGKSPRRLNYVGALLNVGTFGMLISGMQALAHDTTRMFGILELAACGLLAVALVRHEIGRAAPIIPFDLLKIRLFSLSIATSVASFMAQMAALVALPFEIQRIGHSAVETGLLMTPWPVAVAVAAPIAGRLSDRHPAGLLGGAGLMMLATGLALLALFPQGGTVPDFIWRMALCGLGFGFFQAPNNRALLSSAPRARSGAAGGMLATARLLGQTLGAAVVAILFRAFPGTGSNVVLCLASGVALLAALISMFRVAGKSAAAAA